MLAAILALLADASPPPLPRQWAQFTRSGALNHVTETVDIATGDNGGGATFRYKLRLTRQAISSAPVTMYADSATCPAIPSIIASMQNIKMPSPAPYGVRGGGLIVMMLDGAGYSLTAPSSDVMGSLTISSNIGSPLATWVDASIADLASCWTETSS